MQFSDTSNLQGLIQDCEFNCQLGNAGISGNSTLLKDFTRLLNKGVNSASPIILRATNTWQWDDLNQTNFPILTANLAIGHQDYSFPGDILQIYKVEVDYDGSGKFKVATQIDTESNDIASDTTSVNSNFSKSEPKYNVIANSLFLYPIPDTVVSAGLKIYITREISKFASTDTTKEPGIDDPFHQYVSLFASYEYARAKGLRNVEQLKRDLNETAIIMSEYYSMKSQNTQYNLRRRRINWK